MIDSVKNGADSNTSESASAMSSSVLSAAVPVIAPVAETRLAATVAWKEVRMTAEDELNYAIGYVGALPSKYKKLAAWCEALEGHLKLALVDVEKLRDENRRLSEFIESKHWIAVERN